MTSSSSSIIHGLCLCCLCLASNAETGAAAAASNNNNNNNNVRSSTSPSRILAEEKFVNLYEPTTNVDGTALIDKDVRTVYSNTLLGTLDNIQEAENVYSKGAFATSIASLSFTDADAVLTNVPVGTLVTGMTETGDSTSGVVLETVLDGDRTTLKVQYNADKKCYVGGLSEVIQDDCFASSTADITSNVLSINGQSGFVYSYNASQDTSNGHTLQSFGQPGERRSAIHDLSFNYIGSYDYADMVISAAFKGASTSFPEQQGDSTVNFNFADFGIEGRSAFLRWGIIGMNIWTQVIFKLQQATELCSNGNVVDARVAWDQAVAIYTGSIPKITRENGYLLYSLAERECQKFGTCQSSSSYTAMANINIFEKFNAGKTALLSSSSSNAGCNSAKTMVEQMQSQMMIPLIQSLLGKAYALDIQDDPQEITQGEAAAFAASVLPAINACQMSAADLIRKDFAPGKGTQASFEVLKFNLERTYDCLGITCSDVGGLVDIDPNTGLDYLKGAEPCDYVATTTKNTSPNDDRSSTFPTDILSGDKGVNIALALGLSALVLVLVTIGVVIGLMCRRREGGGRGGSISSNNTSAKKNAASDLDAASTEPKVEGGELA